MKNIKDFIEENKTDSYIVGEKNNVYYYLKTGDIVILEDNDYYLKTLLENIEEEDIIKISKIGLLNFFNGNCIIPLSEEYAKKYLKGYGLYLLRNSLENNLKSNDKLTKNKYKL